MEKIVTLFDPIFPSLFRLHDALSAFLARHFFTIKKVMLLIAHLSLFGFFFPEFRRDFGAWAGNLLIFILFLSPISKIFRTRLLNQLMGLRREMGITFGYLATVHGLGYLIDPEWRPFILMASFGEGFGAPDPRFLLGMVAYMLTLPLLFTSNTLANRLLGGRRWKLLHTLVYLVFFFVVIHRALIFDKEPWYVIQAIILLSSYILAKLLAWKNFLPPLVQVIRLVAERYAAYRKTLAPPAPLTPPPTPSSLPGGSL